MEGLDAAVEIYKVFIIVGINFIRHLSVSRLQRKGRGLVLIFQERCEAWGGLYTRILVLPKLNSAKRKYIASAGAFCGLLPYIFINTIWHQNRNILVYCCSWNLHLGLRTLLVVDKIWHHYRYHIKKIYMEWGFATFLYKNCHRFVSEKYTILNKTGGWSLWFFIQKSL